MPSDPLALVSAAALDECAALLRHAAVRLTGAAARARSAADAADWQAPSARVFAERADDLSLRLTLTEAAADDLVDTVARLRVLIALQVAS